MSGITVARCWRAPVLRKGMFLFVVLLISGMGPPSDLPKTVRRDTSEPLNLLELYKAEYAAGKQPTIVNTTPAKYLALTGRGEPGGGEFVKKVGVLYGTAYAVKMKSKFTGRDFVVAPLEGLWWGTNKKRDFIDEPRDTWNWKLLIRVPEFITNNDMPGPRNGSADRGKSQGGQGVTLETLDEGKCVQALHVGPYSEEPATIAGMKAFALKKGLAFSGVHHEIYLNDPSRVPPEQLRTILRYSVK